MRTFLTKPSVSWSQRVSFLLGFLLLAGCAGKDEEAYKDRSLEELYHEGRTFLFKGQYHKAAKAFDEVERQHPYSDWAPQAQLMAAYAYYLDRKYEDALDPIESFIQLHPAHKDIAYAFYLQGLCYYERLAPIERDQDMARFALDSFQELIKRFPGSVYAKDAKLKIDLLQDNLAAKEMNVGRYYLGKKAYLAALNRFRKVVETYQTTAQVEEALHRLVEVYLSLGLVPEARKAAATLGHNFPTSPWYADTYLLMKGEDFRTQAQKRAGESWLDHLDFFTDRASEEEKRQAAHRILTPEGTYEERGGSRAPLPDSMRRPGAEGAHTASPAEALPEEAGAGTGEDPTPSAVMAEPRAPTLPPATTTSPSTKATPPSAGASVPSGMPDPDM